jgi:superoxide reductase
VTIGKNRPPNKTEHHISGIDVYFRPDGDKFSYKIGSAEFGSHGASTQGPDTSTIYTHHEVILSFKTEKPGTLVALSLCNIHGLWENHVSRSSRHGRASKALVSVKTREAPGDL